MSHFKFTEGQTQTTIEKHHTKPYSVHYMQVRENVCEKVREKLENLGVARCNWCKEDCITNQK